MGGCLVLQDLKYSTGIGMLRQMTNKERDSFYKECGYKLFIKWCLDNLLVIWAKNS